MADNNRRSKRMSKAFMIGSDGIGGKNKNQQSVIYNQNTSFVPPYELAAKNSVQTDTRIINQYRELEKVEEELKYHDNVVISQSIEEEIVNDMGYLMHTPSYYSYENHSSIYNPHANQKLSNFMSNEDSVFGSHEKLKNKRISSIAEVITTFSMGEKCEVISLDLDNIGETIQIQNELLLASSTTRNLKATTNLTVKSSVKGVKSKTTGTKNTVKDGQKGNDDNEEIPVNTENSYFRENQIMWLNKNKEYIITRETINYNDKKMKYEAVLLQSLVDKAEDSQASLGMHPLKYQEPFDELKKSLSKKYPKGLKSSINKKRNDYDKTAGGILRYKNDCSELKTNSRTILTEFINGMYTKIKKENEESSADSNFLIWKNKLSEIVNIWDLFNSNGVEVKLNHKYFTMKKFLNDRSYRLQNNIDLKIKENKSKDLFGTLLTLGDSKVDKKKLPTAIFLQNDQLRITIDIVIALLLLYTFIMIPLRLMIGEAGQSKFFIFFDKFVDMFFYIDIICNMRTVYKDQSNNNIFDIKMITMEYLKTYFIIDFVCSVPWSFFFLWNPRIKFILQLLVMVKVLRVVKLGPLLNKLEQMQGANYVRLFKLLLIYFLITHWMAVIMFNFVDFSLIWSESNDICYKSNNYKIKPEMKFGCAYLISFFNAAYIIPGEYVNYMIIIENLNPSSEYLVFIIEYLLGSVLSAYTFGGMASIIQNLNQGQNFFTQKTDLLREHMLFYEIPNSVQNDIRIYYDYLWQRHKDVIYGKHHFNLLSRSLREKFERKNLPGNEIYLARFYALGNMKLVGEILMNLRKYINFPYENLFHEGSLAKGLYILIDGDLTLKSISISNMKTQTYSLVFSDILEEENKRKKNSSGQGTENFVLMASQISPEKSVIFPLMSAFIKTGRNWQTCFSSDFSDLLFLPLEKFDSFITNFPIEMHLLKHKTMEFVDKNKLFDNPQLFNMVCQHSARSIGKYFEKEYDKFSIWIPIAIPISQRKIAKNYIPSLMQKVNSMYREIMLSGDLDICLNSAKIVSFLKPKKHKVEKQLKKGKEQEEEETKIQVNSSDPLDGIKDLAKQVEVLIKEFSMYKADIDDLAEQGEENSLTVSSGYSRD